MYNRTPFIIVFRSQRLIVGSVAKLGLLYPTNDIHILSSIRVISMYTKLVGIISWAAQLLHNADGSSSISRR